jgi:hypothetical protein
MLRLVSTLSSREIGGHLLSNIASGVRVGLDTSAVLAVHDNAVLEDDVLNGVVALAANGTNAETMTTAAVHVGDGDTSTTGDGNAVILVVDVAVLQHSAVRVAEIETIRVVSSWVAIGVIVGLITSGVVEGDVVNGQIRATGDGEAMRGPVLDVQILDGTSRNIIHNEEMIGLVLSTIATLTVPPSLTVAIDDGARLGGDGDVIALDHDHVVVRLLVPEGSGACKRDRGSILKITQVQGLATRNSNAVQDDRSTRLNGSSDVAEISDGARIVPLLDDGRDCSRRRQRGGEKE